MKIRQNDKQDRQGDAVQTKAADAGAGELPFVDRRGETVRQNQLAKMAGESPGVAAQLAAARRIGQGTHMVRQLARVAWVGKDPIQLLTKDSGTQFPLGVMTARLENGISESVEDEKGGWSAACVDTSLSYKPNADAPDDPLIRLTQTVRSSDPVTGDVTPWRGAEARRNKTMTVAGEKVAGGWFVDHTAAALRPRADAASAQIGDAYADASFASPPKGPELKQSDKKTDAVPAAEVKPANLDDLHDDDEDDTAPEFVPYKDLGKGSQHGSKVGGDIKPATLRDHPAWARPYKFEAEVAAKGTQAGREHIYGVATWGFQTKRDTDAKRQVVEKSEVEFKAAPSAAFNAAVGKFNEVYRNRGAETSPENIEAKRTILNDPAGSADAKAAARAELLRIVGILRNNFSEGDPHINVPELGEAGRITAPRVPDNDEDNWAHFPAPDPIPVAAPVVHAEPPARHDAPAEAAPHVNAPELGNAEPVQAPAGNAAPPDPVEPVAEDNVAADAEEWENYVSATTRPVT